VGDVKLQKKLLRVVWSRD